MIRCVRVAVLLIATAHFAAFTMRAEFIVRNLPLSAGSKCCYDFHTAACIILDYIEYEIWDLFIKFSHYVQFSLCPSL
ncbi:MAG: hypothetical protein LBQ66_16890 [Planctomycetaceae bacterium]|nr:hypothetical protein [Planctomycetaceae bacterium]